MTQTLAYSTISWKRRRAIGLALVITILCIGAILLGLAFSNFVSAEKDVTGTMKDAALTSENATNGMAELFSDKMDGTHFTSIFDDFFSGSSAYMSQVRSAGFGHYFWVSVRGIASGIASIAFLLHIADLIPDLSESPERIAAPLVQYMFVMTLIADMDMVSGGLMSIGTGIMNAVKGWQKARFASFECTDIAALMGQMYGPGFKVTAQLLVGLQSLLLGTGLTLVMYIVDLGIYRLCFSVLFKLVIMDAFLPLGIAWFPLTGFRGGTVRYMKYYAGIWIQIAIFYAIAAVSGTLMSLTVQDGQVTLTECLYIVAIAVSVPRLLKSSGSIMADILAG